MTNHSDPSPPSDVCLLLRAHAEQRWLCHEILPVLRQLEHRDSPPGEQLGQLEQRDPLPEEQFGAALAYLEVLWIEAAGRAAETDAAYAELDAGGSNGDRALSGKARGYHAAVRTMRDVVARHVAQLVAVPSDTLTREHANS